MLLFKKYFFFWRIKCYIQHKCWSYFVKTRCSSKMLDQCPRLVSTTY